jgi:hypothetical protein
MQKMVSEMSVVAGTNNDPRGQLWEKKEKQQSWRRLPVSPTAPTPQLQ